HWLNGSAWRRRHQAIAQFYHFKRRALAMWLRELWMVRPLEVLPEWTIADMNYLAYVKIYSVGAQTSFFWVSLMRNTVKE
ncbi:hypothetical protein C7B65_27080, partial [Phormidesmis priestleyi ULC007]